MKLFDLIRYELKWRFREPLTLCFIYSPILILAMLVFGLVPERLVDLYESYYSPPEALYLAIMQISSVIWLILMILVIAKNYNVRSIFLSLPANSIQQWTAKVISLLAISVLHMIHLILVLCLAKMIAANEIVVNPLHMLLICLSWGGVLMVFLALSAYVRNRILFVGVSFFIIIAPTAINSFSRYFIGNFIQLPYFSCDNIPETIVFFFKYCLPIYYVLSFFIGYFGYRKKKISDEI